MRRYSLPQLTDLLFRFRVAGFWVSGFRFRDSGFGFRVSGFGSRVLGLGFRVSGFGSRVPGLESRVSVFGFRVSGFNFRISGLGSRVPGFESRVSGFGFRVSDFGFRVSGFLPSGRSPGSSPVASASYAALLPTPHRSVIFTHGERYLPREINRIFCKTGQFAQNFVD